MIRPGRFLRRLLFPPESKIRKIYQGVLGRPPAPEELRQELKDGDPGPAGLRELRRRLMESDEFFNRLLAPHSPWQYHRIGFARKWKLQRHMQRGRSFMRNKRVVFAGLLRDKVGNVPHVRDTLRTLASGFADHHILVVENDSTDGTRAALEAWARQDPQLTLLGGHLGLTPTVEKEITDERIRKMSHLRNLYLEEIERRFADFDFLIVLDLDIRGHPYPEGLASSFALFADDPACSMIACNGQRMEQRHARAGIKPHAFPFSTHYYDIFAFTPLQSEEVWERTDDARVMAAKLQTLQGSDLDVGAPVIPVTSAFGGMAVYHLPQVLGKRYGYSPGRISCEHTHLNRQLPRCLLNPSMFYFILES